jgi:hypothetical protein
LVLPAAAVAGSLGQVWGAAEPALEPLQFLAGCWAGSRGSETFEEMWIKPSGTLVVGVSRTRKADKTVFTEYMQVSQEAAGLVMRVQLKLGSTVTEFKLVKSEPGHLVFENPEHDFPQRVLYKKVGDDGLLGRIEGVSKGKQQAVDYPMKRVDCR